MKNLLLLPVIALILLPISAANAGVEGKNPKLLIDTFSEDEIKDLNIVVPKETDAGFQVLTIQIYDDNGVQSERFVYFCKDLKGDIHWDNICPDLDPLATKKELSQIGDLKKLPKYSPAQESKKSAGIIAVAIVLFLALSSARRRFSESATATFVSLAADKKHNGEPRKMWGDRSITWKFPGYRRTDYWFSDFSTWLSTKSLIFARIVGDADYARAMFGALWLVIPLASPTLGFFAAQENDFQYMTPTMPYLLSLLALGAFDAFAGFLAGWTFVITILLKNHPNHPEEVLLLVAIALLGYALVPLGESPTIPKKDGKNWLTISWRQRLECGLL